MNMRTVLRVAYYEYRAHVRRKGFLLSTLGLPLIILIIGLVLLAVVAEEYQKYRTEKTIDLKQPIAVIDKAGVLPAKLPPPFIFASNIGQGEEEVRRGNYLALVLIPRNYTTTHQVTIVVTRGLTALVRLYEATRVMMTYAELHDRYTFQEVQRLIEGPDIDIITLDTFSEFLLILSEDELRRVSRIPASILLAYVYFLATGLSSGYLIQSIAKEKNNRIAEILLSSMAPTELLGGKVIGLSALGLTGLAIWLLSTGLFLKIAFSSHLLPKIAFFALRYMDLQLLFILLLIMPISYITYALLIAGMGAIWDSMTETTHLYLLVFNFIALPVAYFLLSPRASLLQMLSYLPLAGMMATLLRWSLNSLPWWELVLIAWIHLLGALGSIWVGVRLFRAGILLQGRKPSLRELRHILFGAL